MRLNVTVFVETAGVTAGLQNLGNSSEEASSGSASLTHQ